MWIGFTDTDDANDAIADGAPVQMVYTDQGEDEMGTLVIPNTVMLIKGGKNVDNAQKLMDYLVSAEAESMLAYSKAAQMPLLPDVDVPDNVPAVEDVKAMQVDWYGVYDNLAAVLTFVEENLVSN
jgi:iron(III) transport system substrate-binding protein